jgi:hypothetical protein
MQRALVYFMPLAFYLAHTSKEAAFLCIKPLIVEDIRLYSYIRGRRRLANSYILRRMHIGDRKEKIDISYMQNRQKEVFDL